jgi:hypothetical protein
MRTRSVLLLTVVAAALSWIYAVRLVESASRNRVGERRQRAVQASPESPLDTLQTSSSSCASLVMWRLFTDRGQQVWRYATGAKTEQLPQYDADANPVSAGSGRHRLIRLPE